MEFAPYQRAAVNVEVRASNAKKREVLHLISTDSVDRAGDIVDPKGAELERFLANPIVMRNHSYLTQDIIGRAEEIRIEKGAIWARTTFRDTEIGRDAFGLAKEGLAGWSIGFRPYADAVEEIEGTRGLRFKRWELLEYSQVPIPMNADAVMAAVQRGLVHDSNVKLFFDVETAAKPVQSADHSPNVERAPIDVHPAMEAIAKASRALARSDAARRIADAARGK